MKKTFLFLTLFLTILACSVRAQVPVFTEGFEDTSLPTGWTIIDADQDGNNWEHISVQGDLSSGHTGTGAYASYSYEDSTYEALTPNNWLVTPAIALSGTSSLTYWFMVAQSYPADHYGVYVSTTSATDTSAFTLLYEETPTAAHGTWTMRTVDLTSYAGNTVYIAFRHFNCTDEFLLVLDDITVYSTSSESVLMVTPETISFGGVEINTTSTVQTVHVVANNISETVFASVAAPFEISADNTTFGSTATLPVGGGDLYVRYAPTATGASQDTLTITAGSFSQTVILSGYCFNCSSITLPLVESFESVEGLSCWLAGNASSSNPNSIVVTTQFASDGTHSLRFSSYSEASDYNQYVITPELPVSPSKIVSFDYKNSNAVVENFRVGYSTTTPTISAFTWKPGVSSDSTNWGHYIASDIPGDAKYIAINYYSNYKYYLFIDNFMVQEGSDCVTPSELSVSAVTGTTANLSWSNINGTYNIYYKVAADSVWSEEENLVLQDEEYILNGLTPSTTYDWYVEIVCDDGSTSSSPISSFTTSCDVITVTDDNPYVLDFTLAPECWLFPDNDGDSWTVSSGHLEHDFGTYEVEAFSPLLDISDVSTPYLKFDQRRPDYFGSGVADELYVYLRSAASGAETDWLQMRAYTDIASNWTFDSLPIPNNMSIIQLKFKAIGNGNSADGCYIDNVSVYNELNAPACTPPAGLTASNITESSAELSWTMTDNGSVNIYYKTAADEEFSIVENVTTTNGVYVLENLSASTTYEWYMGIVCSDGSIIVTPSTTFNTLCGAVNAPHFQGFENLATNAIPNCWNVINPYQNYPGAISNYAYEGAQMLKFNNNYSIASPQYAVMPEFADNFNTLQINFWCRREGANSGTFSVGYVTDPVNGNTFTPIWSISGEQIGDNDYHNYTVKFDSVNTMPDVHYYITFRYECTTEWFWYLDNVRVMLIPECNIPENLTTNNISTTSADLGWTSNASSYTLYYKPVTDSIYSSLPGITLNADGIYTLGNLMPGTYYDWYVAAECVDGTLSPSFSSGSFITQCMDIASVPVTWGFENNLFGGTTSYPLPACWAKASTNNYPYVTMNYAHSGDYKLHFYNNYSNAFAVLPDIDTAALPISSLQVSLYAKMSSNSYQCAIELGVMTDPSDASTFTAVASYDLTDEYTLYEFPLNTYSGNGKYVAFHVMATGSAYNNTYVDDVTLDHIPACSRPMSLTSDPDITSATLSWTSTASSFNLYYKESTESEWQIDFGISLDSNNEYELSSLNPATAYDWYVETDCEGTEPLSSAIAHFYTTDTPTPLPYQTTFANASDWNLINGTCTNYWTAGTPSGETESALFITNNGTAATYTKTASTVVMAEKLFAMPTNTDSVLVEFDVTLTGEGALTPYDYLKVFLAPTSENFEASTSGSNAQSSHSNAQYALNFSVYKSQTGGSANYPYVIHLTQGNTIHVREKMVVPGTNGKGKLVFLWRNDNSGGNDPAAIIRNFSISGSGDTTVVEITDPTVSTTAASDIEQTTATLNATIDNPDNVTITAKGFEWKATAGGTYTQVAGTGNGDNFTANLTDLTPNTSYTYKAFITYNGTTVYGDEMTFTTLPEDTPEPCEAPTNLRETGEIIDKSIGYLFVVWDDHANASQWNLQYKLSSENNWTYVVVTGNPTYTFENLEADSEYNLRVQAICDENNLSEWSNVLTATAQGVGINDYLLNSIALYPNPANDVVNVECTMNNVQLEGIEIIDVYGKVVRTVVGANNYSPMPIRINVSGLANGMYFVRVTMDEGTVTKTFVKR